SFTVPPNVCAGQPANFAYTGGVTGTGSWTFTGGTPSTANGLGPQSASWNTPGTYNVSLTVTPGSGLCAPGSLTQSINVVAPPNSAFNLPASVCMGNSAAVSFAGSAPPGSIYSWNFGAGASPATASTVGPHNVSWSTTGTKTVSLTLTTGACSSTTTHTINVSNAPTSNFTLSPTTVCVGSNSTATFTGAAAPGATFAWNFGAGASPATANTVGPHTISWSSAGSKNITLTVSAGGCSSPVTTQTVNVNSIPTASFVLPASVCISANASISYNGAAPAPPAATYNWNVGGGTPAPGNVQGPFGVSWSTAGAKNVTLTVSQNGCTSAPVSQSITVNALPSVSITSSSSNVCLGSNVNYSIVGGPMAPGTTYNWNFGAGATPATSTLATPPAVSYSSAGVKTATLTVVSGGCTSAPASVNISVISPPPAVISAPATACLGSTVSISATGPFTGGTTFNWNFGSGTIASGSGAGPYQVSWASAGNQTISLTVTSGVCSASTSFVIDVRSGPTASFNAPSPICQGSSSIITYTGTGVAGDTYNWNFGTGATPATATGIGPHSVTWSSAGSKTISLNMISGGCTLPVVSQTVTVNAAPIASFTAPTPVCSGNASIVTFTGTPAAGASYSWNFGSGASPATATGIGPHSVTWANAGNSTVSLTMTNGGCSSVVTQNVTVNSGAPAVITAPSITGNGVAVSIGLSGPAQVGAAYSWNFGANASPGTATGAGPHSVTYSATGTSTISLSTTLNGCTNTATASIAIVNAATSTFTATPTVCAGSNALITYSGNASPAASYTWNFGGGTATPATGQGPHNVTWTTAGSKTITLTVTEGGFTSTQSTQTVVVNPTPTSSFSLPANACLGAPVSVSYTGNANVGALYAWNFGSGASPATAMGQGPHSVSYSTGGAKSVTLQVIQSGCSSTTTSNSINIISVTAQDFNLPGSACENGTVSVSLIGATQPVVSYAWNFGLNANPATAVGAGPHNVFYTNSGSKTVSLITSSGACSAPAITHSINIVSPPTSSFTVSNPVCEGDLVVATYNGNAGAGANFTWTYPSGTLVSGSGPGPLEILFPSAGSYSINLTVDENTCLSALSTQNVSIESAPVFTISSPSFAGENAPVSITYSGDTPVGATYTWDFDGATIISGSGSGPYQVSWAVAGIYTISCSVTNGVCPPVTQSTNTEVLLNALATFTADSPVCESEISTVTFTGTTLASATFAWDFDGGNIVSGSASGPFEITWNSPGVKNISLVVTQMGIASPAMTQQVLVNQIPTALFVSPTALCSGQESTFIYTGNATGNATYSWDFGSGTLITSVSGSTYDVSFPSEGSENITLQVTENGCVSSVESVQLFVQSPPSATFTATPSACEGEIINVTYTGGADPTASFNWDFDAGSIISGSGQGPFEIEYPAAGMQNISLETAYGGCTSQLEINQVNINPIPTATFDIVGNTCAGDTVNVVYTGNAGLGATYVWDFEALIYYSGNEQGPYQAVFPGYGTYPIGLYITDNGCTSDVEVVSATFEPSPTATFTLTDTVFTDQNAFATFTGNAPTGTITSWDYAGAALVSGSPEDELILTYSAEGTYNVTLEMSLGACVDGPVTEQIVVLPMPGSEFSVSQDTICAGTALFVTYDGIGTSQAQYNWDFDGANIASGTGSGPYQLDWSTEGVKTITLSVTVAGITTTTTELWVNVIAVPVADFSIVEELCVGDTLQATYSAITTLNAQFSWDSDNADFEDFVDNANPLFAWTNPGQKTVVLSIADAMCISTPVMHTVMVHDIPQASFDMPDYACRYSEAEVLYTGTASQTAAFNWDFGTAEVIDGSGAGPISLLWNEPGNVEVTLQVTENGCSSEVYSETLFVRELPIANAGEDFMLCSSDTVALQALNVAGYSFTWFPAAGLSSDTVASPDLSLSGIHNYIEEFEYQLQVSDSYCLNSDTLIVSLAPMPRASFVVPEDQCFEGNSFDFVNDGAFTEDATFNWNLGPHAYTHSPSEEHQMDVEFDVEGAQIISLVISQYGCVSDVFFDSVQVNPHPMATFDIDGVKGCVPLESSFMPIPEGDGSNYSYSWNFGDGESSNANAPIHTYLESGYMTVSMVVSNQFGCSAEVVETSAVQVLEQPVAGFRTQPETIFIGADDMELISLAENAQFSYYIIEGDTILGFTSTYSFDEEGVYEITQVVVNAAGCTDQITHSVVVEYGTEYYVPSAFSPNNDGNNEAFLVVGNDIKQFSLRVFDRWGGEIFFSEDINQGWNGLTQSNEPMPEGVYVYRLEMRSKTNRDIVKSGQVTLLR
ncbi:MAG: PKD domain-containing protein, partial [Bacteroidia bacterium]